MRAQLVSPVLLLAACPNDIQVADKGNVAPAVVINAPSGGSAFTDTEVVELLGTVSDGDGLDDLGVVVWTSSLDGELGDPAAVAPDSAGLTRASVLLSVGTHVVTLRAVDLEGAIAEESVEVVIGQTAVEPVTTIEEPFDGALVLVGDEVSLIGSVADAQDAPEALSVLWVLTDRVTGEPVDQVEASPSPSGLVQSSWTASILGDWKLELVATDPDGNTGRSFVTIEVDDPSLVDRDDDGFSPAAGDCDDDDPAVSPVAEEICPDLIDQDCNAAVDDKDADLDGHVDLECTTYTGVLPPDDCDDTELLVFPGAPEAVDGLDNDCDGWADDGTAGFDDDGDCWCELGPCTGSIEPRCGALVDGDCDDDSATISPDRADAPDLLYVDDNCDGVDGNIGDSVFVDPVNGSIGADGLTPATPVRSLVAAFDAAAAEGRSWVLMAPGVYTFLAATSEFSEGVNLAGGYDASFFDRSAVEVPEITVGSAGKTLAGWTTPTEWQQIHLRANAATASSGSSVALTLEGSTGLVLVECEIEAGAGGDGGDGVGGSVGGAGRAGAAGEQGCENGSGGFCSGGCSTPMTGDGGLACTGGNNGGEGGVPGLGGANGTAGTGGVGADGAGGARGLANGGDGADGGDGGVGTTGANGVGGGSVGTFSSFLGYLPANGSGGLLGGVGGGGGGGGGGAGGGWSGTICDTYGGAGGGGGGGGCGGGGASGGIGGGASVAVMLLDGSSLTVIGGTFRTGAGGAGGDGGSGGNGGPGGVGGAGGPGVTYLGQEKGGDGGAGGPGGAGGRGGHGGGGGGGPSVGVVCRAGSSLTDGGATYVIGAGGAGGGGPGIAGTDGLASNDDGC